MFIRRLPLVAGARRRLFQTSELTNGMRVVTVKSPAEFDAAGIAIRYSRLPDPMKHLALPFNKSVFKGNQTLKEDDLLDRLDAIIGSSHDRVFREHLLLGGAVSPQNVPDLLKLLNDLLRSAPNGMSQQDFSSAVEYDFYEQKIKQPDKLMQEIAITAALPHLGTSTIHHLLKCRQENANNNDHIDLQGFWKSALAPTNVSIIGLSSWTNHNDFVAMANDLFVDWPLNGDPKPTIENEKQGKTAKDDDIFTLQDDEQPLCHLSLTYPGLPRGHPQYVTLRVLERLLGGGGSFSAGGPGKGMYARLYTSVLNRYYWMESAKCFTAAFSSDGLLGIHGSAPVSYARDLARILNKALLDTADRPITDEELDRAKAQLKSAAFMDGEGRLGQLDDVSEQIVHTKTVMLPTQFGEAVDAVTGTAIQDLVRSLVNNRKPTIAVFGQTKNLPPISV